MEKKALGRGLEALLPTAKSDAVAPPSQEVQDLPIGHIIPNRYQPRTKFSDLELAQLAESIKQHGLIQPIIVRRKGDGMYELIAGERRLRASKLAGLPTIRAIIRNSTDEQAIQAALVENLQREDLNPMEAARAYHRLIVEFGFTQESVAHRMGKDRSSIANIARLLNLPREIQDLVESGQIRAGHAKVLVGLTSPDAQHRLARQIIEQDLSVRQAEQAAAALSRSRPSRNERKHGAYKDLEERLQKRVGTRVHIVNGKKGGKLELYYFSPEELDRIVELLLN